MLNKSPLDIITEAAKTESFSIHDMYRDDIKDTFNNTVKNLMTVDSKLFTYAPERVPVFANEGAYYVEIENVLKCMETIKTNDILEALDMIAEANDVRSLSLVIESVDYMQNAINEADDASKMGNNVQLEKCNAVIELVKTLKRNNINVVIKK